MVVLQAIAVAKPCRSNAASGRQQSLQISRTSQLGAARRHCQASQVWSGTIIRDISCCYHPLTGVPHLRPGPRTDGQPGGVFLVSNTPSISKPWTDGRRDTLTLSLSANGLAFDRHFVVRDRAASQPIQHPGYGKYPRFQYRAGMWRMETAEMIIVYSEG